MLQNLIEEMQKAQFSSSQSLTPASFVFQLWLSIVWIIEHQRRSIGTVSVYSVHLAFESEMIASLGAAFCMPNLSSASL
jgi:hypothetical protein